MTFEESCLENVTDNSTLIEWLNKNIDDHRWMCSFQMDSCVNMDRYRQLLIEPKFVKGHWVFLFEKEDNEEYLTVLFVEDARDKKILTITFISVLDIVEYWHATKDDEYISMWEEVKEQCDEYNKLADKNLSTYEFLKYLYVEFYSDGLSYIADAFNQWFFHDVNKKNFFIKRFEKTMYY